MYYLWFDYNVSCQTEIEMYSFYGLLYLVVKQNCYVIIYGLLYLVVKQNCMYYLWLPVILELSNRIVCIIYGLSIFSCQIELYVLFMVCYI